MKYGLILVIVFACCSCNVHYMVKNDEFEVKPRPLKETLQKGSLDAECPLLLGKYHETPKTYEFVDGNYIEVETKKYTSLFAFRMYSEPMDDFREGRVIDPPINVEDFFLGFKGISEAGVLRLNSIHAKGNMIHEHFLRVMQEGGSCADGSLIYPEEKNASGGDGMFFNRKSHKEVYRNSLGEILVYEQVGLWYSSIFTPGRTHMRHFIYRFASFK